MRFASTLFLSHEEELLLIRVQLINQTAGSRQGLISHAGGVAKLIEHRGPTRHQNYPEKTIYLETRMMLVRFLLLLGFVVI